MNGRLDESSDRVKHFEQVLDYSYAMSLLSERVRRIMAEMKWRPVDLANAAGSRRAAPTEWTKGKVKNMSAAYAAAIAAKTPFHATWIATGEGPVYKRDTPKPVDDWPFELFTRERFESLPERVKGRAEQAAVAVMDDYDLRRFRRPARA